MIIALQVFFESFLFYSSTLSLQYPLNKKITIWKYSALEKEALLADIMLSYYIFTYFFFYGKQLQ